MIAHSEIGAALLAVSDNGYNVLVGSTSDKPLLFQSYASHPGIYNPEMNSTAAGRYQVLKRYAWAYTKSLALPDFGHDSQDAIALQQIKESGALDDIDAGRFEAAVAKCNHIWASLPGAGYNQHETEIAGLEQAYIAAGGTLS